MKCKECGNEISRELSDCPHCGYPLGIEVKRKTRRLVWIWLGFSIVIIAVITATLIYLSSKQETQVNEYITDQFMITPELTLRLEGYDQVDAFSEGLAAVKKEEKWGYINIKGEEVIPCQFADNFPPGQFSEGLACVVDDRNPADKSLVNKRVGFINTKGEWVITGDYFTQTPHLGTVWGDVSHQLPSFKNGKCAVWSHAVYSRSDENDEDSKEYMANHVVLIDKSGKKSEVSDAVAKEYESYHPYAVPQLYKDIACHQEKVSIDENYYLTIARDTTMCDNGARLVTWQVLDINNYPYSTEELGVQYFLDSKGKSSLLKRDSVAMVRHLQELVSKVKEKRELREREENSEASYSETSYSAGHSGETMVSDRELEIMNELSRLGREGQSLVVDLGTLRNSGRLDLYTYQNYKERLLAIKDCQISLARQLSDSEELVRQYRQQKRDVERALERMQGW